MLTKISGHNTMMKNFLRNLLEEFPNYASHKQIFNYLLMTISSHVLWCH